MRERLGEIWSWLRPTLIFGSLFVGLPLTEALLLAALGSVLGIGWTFVIVLLTGLVGGWAAKREGLHLLRELSEELKRGLPPGERLTEGALVVAGGLLMITPGVLTDLAGLLLMFRPSRRWLAPRVLSALLSWLGAGSAPAEDLGDGASYRQPRRPQRAAAGAASNPFASKFDDLP